MFSIYGESGRLFKGPMEDLWRIEALRAVMRTRRVEAQREGTSVRALQGHSAPVVAPHTRAGVAVSAYAQAGGSPLARHPLTRVADVMSRRVTTVTLDLPVLQAWQLLGREGLGQAPVISAHGELAGLLTRAELLNLERLPQPDAPALAWRALLMQPVSSVMLSPVPAVSEDTDLRRVARVLLDTHLPGLPVVVSRMLM